MTPDWSVAEVQEFVPQGFDTMVRPPFALSFWVLFHNETLMLPTT